MPEHRIHIITPEPIAAQTRSGKVHMALNEIAQLAGCALSIADTDATLSGMSPNDAELPIHGPGDIEGRLLFTKDQPRIAEAAQAIAGLLEHQLQRESAVTDLAGEMITSYEELNILYSLLPNIATKVHPDEIGRLLVRETSNTLNCRRVSVLMLDEENHCLRVLASCGLPEDAEKVSIPISTSVAGRVMLEEDLLIVNDAAGRPDLRERSVGTYDTESFVAVRLPLMARGQALGVLTATERIGDPEFTARDHKLLEALSAVGASALLNCRLHAAFSRQMLSTIRALASAVDAKDHYTHDHSGRVAQYSVRTAHEMGVDSPAERNEIELAGLLHDIGKIGIPDAILSKKSRLTPSEFAVVKKHAEIGARIVGHVEGLTNVAKAILHHHERHDGLGYPCGIAGEDIPYISKLIAVADVFDCITSDRPYRERSSIDDALQELVRCKGTHFDGAVVDAFVTVLRRDGAIEIASKTQVS